MSELPALSPILDRLRDHVLEHSVKTGEFVLKSGAFSSWFLDTKQTACRADGIIAVTDAVTEVFGDDLRTIDAIGGLTLGADPMAYGVAAVLGTRGIDLRSFSVRKEAKQGGVTGRIAGALRPGDRVLVTEDTTTRGTSLIEAVDQIEAFGAEPIFMSVIVDRGGTCADMANQRGIDYRPLLVAPDLGYDYGT
ncbi:MAG: phosphoribosyltransferase family protein [Ilumatobacter sp.]|nr:phosphoribosyltransferase family protein [Ilumatobacter sp.]MDG2039509.1 phosphoribosyltransferase family protein [Ilumatobacter sp.]